MKNVRIHVLPDDIAAGVPRDAARCPVANAVNRYLPGKDVTANRVVVKVWTPGDEYPDVSAVPPWVGDIIQRYDNTRVMDPFEFDIEAPDDLEVAY